MPTLTTQSIGVAGVPLTAGYHAGSIAQSTKSATEAGIQRAQNHARATSETHRFKSGKHRTIQDEKRVEGLFESGSEECQREETRAQNERSVPYFRIA